MWVITSNSPIYPKHCPLISAEMRKARLQSRAFSWHRHSLVVRHSLSVIGHLQAIPSPSLSAQQRLAEMQEDLF
jgi:hypothetical protein